MTKKLRPLVTDCKLSVSKNSDQLQVTYAGDTHTVNVSRETSIDDDGNETETTTYKLDGNEIDSTTFTTFYNKLVNMAGQKTFD